MKPPPETPAPGTGTPRGLWLTFAAVLAGFVLFLAILWFAYVPQRRAALAFDLAKIPAEEQWKYTPEGRAARLAELRKREQELGTNYAMLDRAKGTVQLPLDVAVQLTIKELNAARPAPAAR